MSLDADTTELLYAASAGDQRAWSEILTRYGERVRRMIDLRMDRRLQGRIDSSDVLQETFLEAVQRLREYLQERSMPFVLWVRFLAGQRLLMLHRRHLGAQKREASRELSLFRGPLPQASTASLAMQLLGHGTSPSQAAMKAELQLQLQEALYRMEPVDREIIALRHFEQLNNSETSQVLGLRKSTASSRYLRALRRLKQILREMNLSFEV